MRPNLFGIDHELLNKQIMDYKKMKVSRHMENIPWTEKQQQQLSKIQKKMKKKKTRDLPDDDDITPQKHLLDRYEAGYWEDNTESASDYELQDELQEEVNEVEVDDDKTLSQSTGKLKWSKKATLFKMKAANNNNKKDYPSYWKINFVQHVYHFLIQTNRFAPCEQVC